MPESPPEAAQLLRAAQEALARAQDAMTRLLDAWEAYEFTTGEQLLADDYPEFLPSFDEVVQGFVGVRLRPASWPQSAVAISSPLRLKLALRGPRILGRAGEGSEVLVAEFPRSGDPRLDSLRPVYAQICLAALAAELDPEAAPLDGRRAPLGLLGLSLAACDEADTAFAVLNITDGLTSQARRALGTAWTLVPEAIGAARGADSAVAQAARENLALLRGCVAAETVDRYVAAMGGPGADHEAARAEAIAAAAARPAQLEAGVESVWDLARECVDAWAALDTDGPVSGADLVEWFTEMRARLRSALQLAPQ